MDFEKEITNALLNRYRPLEFMKIYGEKNIEYIAALSARYAIAVLPDGLVKSDTYETLALWLSYVWAIDGIFDKMKQIVTENDVRMLRHIFALPGQRAERSSNKLMISLFDALEILYNSYKTRIGPYLEINENNGWEIIQYWLGRYLDTLLIDDKAVMTMSETKYRSLRLDTGAMMCVVGHSVMFVGAPGPKHVSLYDDLMCDASLAVSYYNDIISMMRDVAQGTPNLVTICKQDRGSLWDSMVAANKLTNDLIDKVRVLSPGRDSTLHKIASAITFGSIEWHRKEPRYRAGVVILDTFLAGERGKFEDLTRILEISTPGDPQANEKK